MTSLFSPPSSDDLIRLLKAWKFWVLGALVGALIGAAVYYIFPPDYRARATVSVDFNLEQAWPQETDRQQFYYLERETRKLEEIAWSDMVMGSVVETVGDTTTEELGRPARELSDKATGAGGIILFILIVGICAPIAEELFFRGLVLRSLENRFGLTWGVVGSSVLFGATHFQFLQFPALTCAGLVFAWLVVRSDSLWSGVVGHMTFNMVTVVSLVWLT